MINNHLYQHPEFPIGTVYELSNGKRFTIKAHGFMSVQITINETRTPNWIDIKQMNIWRKHGYLKEVNNG